MKQYEITEDRTLRDVDTGSIKYYPDVDGNLKYYAIAVKFGHCGNGYFIPIIAAVSAKNKEYAVDIAKNIGGVKHTNKYCILGMKEITKAEHGLLIHINDCDPYIRADDAKTVEDLYSRRVIMKETLSKLKEKHAEDIGHLTIKTRDDYEDKYVLQRFLAPYYVGKEKENLLFPGELNMKQVLDEYYYFNVLELGIKQGRVNALAMYYQIYGDDNNLGISYKNGYMYYTDENGDEQRSKIPDTMYKYLDNMERVKKPLIVDSIDESVRVSSAREKFERRYSNISRNQEISERN